MNRRRFLGTMLGAGAATVLPSEVWPFRKYFLPFFYKPFSFLPPFADLGQYPDYVCTSAFRQQAFNGVWRVDEASIQAIELENVREQIPDLLLNEATFYGMLKRGQLNIRVGDVLTVEPLSIEDRPVARAANQLLRMLKF